MPWWEWGLALPVPEQGTASPAPLHSPGCLFVLESPGTGQCKQVSSSPACSSSLLVLNHSAAAVPGLQPCMPRRHITAALHAQKCKVCSPACPGEGQGVLCGGSFPWSQQINPQQGVPSGWEIVVQEARKDQMWGDTELLFSKKTPERERGGEAE